MLKWIGRGLLALIVLLTLYQVWLFSHVWWWVDHNPSASAFMEEQLSRLQEDNPDAELHHKWVPYERISPNLKRALQTAWEKNLKKGRIVAGGSTISQQLAKNLFLSSRKTPWRKAEEAIITLMLEKMMSKRRIFEIYMNVIEWGNGVFGAEAAARHYYKTSAARLGAPQAAKLAAMVPNPRYYDQNRNDRRLLRKAAIIQRRMWAADFP